MRLGSEEALNLYNVLSIFVSSKNVNAEVRSQTLVLVYSELYNRLTMLSQQAPAELDKVLWTLKFLNSFSKNFQPS